MTLATRSHVIVALLAFVAIACSPAPPPTGSGSSPSGPIEFALPTPSWSIPSGAVEACAGIGIAATLHGDVRDPHVAWLVTTEGTRLEALWLPGYRARFEPSLQVVDPSGAVVIREGDPVSGGCVTGVQTVLLLIPPFN